MSRAAERRMAVADGATASSSVGTTGPGTTTAPCIVYGKTVDCMLLTLYICFAIYSTLVAAGVLL